MKPFPALTPTLRNHATRLFNVHIHAFIVHIPLRSPRLCESLISRGISFLAKPLRALRLAYPSAQPWRPPRLCERPSSRGIFFLAKPLRALRHAYPCAALAFSAPLREPHFSRDVFSRQAAKGTKTCTSLRSLGLLRDFARDLFPAGCFFSPSRKGC